MESPQVFLLKTFKMTIKYTHMSTKVISIRVRKEIIEELEKHGIDVNKELKLYLEKLYYQIKIGEAVEEWKKILENVKPSEEGFAERSVREDRESH